MMALLGDIFGVGGVATLAGKVLDVVKSRVPDVNEQAKVKAELEKILIEQDFQLQTGQLKINEVEAASTNWFVSGARPAALWVCVLGNLYQFLGVPLLGYLGTHYGWGALPNIDIEYMKWMEGGLLGLGAYRTFEKVKSVARS